MRILLTGGSGQIGSALRAQLHDHQITAPARSQLDLERLGEIEGFVERHRPDLVINCAAFTGVDDAEHQYDRTFTINASAAGVVARAAKNAGAAIVHLSTDYVFDGMATRAYLETDACSPLNVYGKTKLEGERLVQLAGTPYLIIRTSWVYAPSGRNFLRTMLRRGTERPIVEVVDDQTGAPTSAAVLATIIAALVGNMRAGPKEYLARFGGILNAACSGWTTWYGFATAIFDEARSRGWPVMAQVRPVKSSDYPSLASRPAFSLLDLGRLNRDFGIVPPSWQAALSGVMDQVVPPEPIAGDSTLAFNQAH